jgi:hypothetical protein
MSSSPRRFRVAISFPGEQRRFVSQVAERLAAELGREKILYDEWHEAEFARPRLATYLPQLYRNETDLIAVFLCADYQSHEWCGLEWDAFFDLIKQRRECESPIATQVSNEGISRVLRLCTY